jgi:hypothetical protein
VKSELQIVICGPFVKQIGLLISSKITIPIILGYIIGGLLGTFAMQNLEDKAFFIPGTSLSTFDTFTTNLSSSDGYSL